MRDWLKHLRAWLSMFPLRDYHVWTSVIGEPEEWCLGCGKTQVKPQEELLEDARLLEKHPEYWTSTPSDVIVNEVGLG